MGRWVFAVPVPGGGACLFCRLPTLPFAFLFAPYPPTPLPRRGRGRPRLFHARGSAPCIPGAEPTRHLHDQRFLFVYGGAVPAAKERGDRGRGTSAFEMVLSPGAGIANAAGGLPFLSPADPAFCFSFCPLSPTPLPRRGRGRPRLFHARGSAPCIPGAEPARHWERGRTTHPAGGAPSLSPACPAFSFASAPSPQPPSPMGKGETLRLFCRGLRPRHPDI